jgi:hypothetical protein
MKRWWTTPRERAWARRTSRRIRPILTRAVVAGVVSLPVSTQASSDATLRRTSPLAVFPRTGGAAVTAWAFGTLSDADQSNSQAACDLAHVCELAISSDGGPGTGTGATIKNDLETPSQIDPLPNRPFTLTEEIDYPHPVTRGVPGNTGQGACYPVNGVMTIAADASSTLVLDIVGQACQVGASPAQLIFTGSYVSDTASTGDFANTDGIGSMSINNPSGLEGTSKKMKASFLGQLKYTP